MEISEKIKLFQSELDKIENEKYREFAIQALTNLVPDYFFTVAASSTGKYHPSYALGEGGLVRHTIAAMRIAIGLFTIMNIDKTHQDAIIVALLLHDSFKHGETHQKYTIANHPVVASDKVLEFAETSEDIEIVQFASIVSSLILTHMGQWNYDYRTRKPFAPVPSNNLQSFVHMCDYLASRKYLEFNFEENV